MSALCGVILVAACFFGAMAFRTAVMMFRERPWVLWFDFPNLALCAALLVVHHNVRGIPGEMRSERAAYREAEAARAEASLRWEAGLDSSMAASWAKVMTPRLDPALEAKYGRP